MVNPLTPLPAVVALGGGHGLSATLAALRRVTNRITAVVTVADDGGSSGRLRTEFDILPPGDLRMALAALCGDDEDGRVWADILQSRFPGDGPLGGHAIGNLLIAGIWERLGTDPVTGLDMVGTLLDVQGRVLPMATVPLEIEAEVLGVDPALPDEMRVVRGQANVAQASGEVRAVRLIPSEPPGTPQALAAIAEADHIVLGPGSWFSSVMPHLLVPDLARALQATSARRTLVLNLTPDDETAGYSAAEHLEFLSEHAPWLRLDTVVVDPSFQDQHLDAYAGSFGARLVIAPVRMSDGSPRHDPNRLASVFADIVGR
ncbi:gluconeogenesis factor YvcK family protein [Nigerium massiliense]|uniref:gluconeogenesis factor YvcK family protein n=1 Tax=Nigerium massiliense TaxID=1522317 RepID=UPI00058C4642|nr:uridine diphosphate-N-acetylglucosamine-binding protein YvcK [Nigerium massiliense]